MNGPATQKGKGATIVGFLTESWGQHGDDPSFRHPAIQVTVEGPNGLPRLLIGMLDTGADRCRLDQEIVSTWTPSGELGGFNSGAPAQLKTYTAKLRVPGLNFELSGEFPSGTYRASGMQYDVLLGMEFLRFFHTDIHGRLGRVRLKFLGV